ncbi:YiiX family permuted papain-like enzyme [Flavobacterium sp.]|uniref:YiiX family permuted papain-like enzyme n=1 Tax=Flavobacterium sp. TaxID=239 RepID=UPI0028BED6ED|nr:YiiX family permuted papain-like enzyme [Flavobacterium sp.]
MKKFLAILILVFITISLIGYINSKSVNDAFKEMETKSLSLAKEGDIIFQTSQSEQSEAIKIATNSKFSHCGIIYISDGEKFVYEAVQPVKLTLLEDWIDQGEDKKYLIKRLKQADVILSPSTLSKMKENGKKYLNKNYDLYFEWSDEKIYCSELVWKIYKEGANIELCSFQTLKNFNLKDSKVKKIMKQRYGNNIPYNEKVIAPSQLVNSDALETVIDTY